MVDVAANYRRIVERIGEAAARCGRKPEEIRLLAAAKSQSAEAVQAAIAAGVTLVGENYVQEAQQKKRQVQGPVEWHMIGHLQRNKAKAAVEVFDVIETLDSVALARRLDEEGRKRGRVVRTYVEVNLGGEPSKSGIAKDEVPRLLEEAGSLEFLAVIGLMTVPPFREDPEQVRPYFRELRELRARLAERFLRHDLRELSMGMTHDYVIAVEEGATIVRIGTGLFGPRP
ncbi:MAG TPA: YggS family pyridoxal phosphate-dependent enzyme [candidate division Zixibacteria bacterium]|nr:YggS family pyridoxal phosphate-dependent enzyme [candidate division Zixibacteria bacterium]